MSVKQRWEFNTSPAYMKAKRGEIFYRQCDSPLPDLRHSVFDFNETEDKLIICFDVDVNKKCIEFYATDNEEGRKHEGMAIEIGTRISSR